MRRRGEVIEYVQQKYGDGCVANIITYGTLGAKMVIRDVSRVHNLPYAEADRLAKMIPDELNITLEQAVAKSAELRDEVEKNPVAGRIFEQARVLEGMVRNTGKHAAGIIITDRPLEEFVPLTLQEGDVTVQFDMNAVGKLGLLKMDFLGLKTLTVIADAVDNIRRDGGARRSTSRRSRSTTRRPSPCSTPAGRPASSSWSPAACRTSAGSSRFPRSTRSSP